MNALMKEALPITPATDVAGRVKALDWERVSRDLDAQGSAMIERLISPAECEALAGLYPEDGIFRSRVVMGRHGFGRGEYKYFSYPLPDMISGLRTSIYPHLVPMANRWNTAMGIDVRYPAKHAEFMARCHDAGQRLPTLLLLQYEAGDYNCLHQDLYGEHVFPFQVTILLSEPGRDFTGGEFVLTEQRPRLQSRAGRGLPALRRLPPGRLRRLEGAARKRIGRIGDSSGRADNACRRDGHRWHTDCVVGAGRG